MPDLLLELRSEEIPARMQRKAAGDLRRMVTDGLVDAGLVYEGCQEYWTPRRLTLDIRGLTARSKDVREERKGPSTKAPEQAVKGFLRSAGLASIEEAEIRSDPKKGDFYVAVISRQGRAAEDIIAGLLPEVIRSFPWPKSMRWGAASGPKGMRYGAIEGRGGEALRWVRPLQSILCTFGPETGEAVVVDFEVDGIRSGNVTRGHRFHAPGEIVVRRFEDYAAKLEAAKVVLDASRRKEIILSDAKNLAFASGLELIEDDALVEEVSGLVEWPVVLMGEFDEDFLSIPAEVIRLTIRANQKCFVTRPGGDGDALAPRFLLTANIEAKDGGAEIALGNGKVVRARLSDALHFWKTDQADLPDLGRLKASAEKFCLDLKKPLDQRMARLDHLNVTFHAKLGTQGERVERIARLAEELAVPLERQGFNPTPDLRSDPPLAGEGKAQAVPLSSPHRGEVSRRDGGGGYSFADLARRAAVLAKADLQTEVVGEFPELQGVMGRKYAALQDEHPSVAAAIEEHYKPQGPSDRVPTDPVSIAVALADKLDTLVGFWAIDEKPTGSKDPYALRRAALGVIRILVENGVRLGLKPMIANAAAPILRGRILAFHTLSRDEAEDFVWFKLGYDLVSFLHERLRVFLRDKGARHDLVDSVLAAGAARPGVQAVLPDWLTSLESSRPISPLVGEMSLKATEGGAVPQESPQIGEEGRSTLPPSALPGISPSRGEITPSSNDDLLLIVRRVEALSSFLDTEDGKNLLAGTKRAANILAAEEKKGTRIAVSVDLALFSDPAEKSLDAAINAAEKEAGEAIGRQDFSAAMRALSVLREPVDSFFEKVLVNDENDSVRANRLALLERIRAATGRVADFSKIAG